MTYIIESTVDLAKPQEEIVWEGIATAGEAEAHELRIRFARNGEILDPAGMDVYLYVRRQDDATVLCRGSIDGEYATAILDRSCYEVAGNITCILLLSLGGKAVCGVRVRMLVRSLHSQTVLDASSVVPRLPELLAMIAVMEARLEDAAAATQAMEETRTAVETAEKSRTQAEEGRSKAETGRTEAETLRELAELGRSGSEKDRETAEEERQEAENERNLAEQTRVSQEKARIAAEREREETHEQMKKAAREAEEAADAIASWVNAEAKAETLEAGSKATATLREDEADGHKIITFGIPRGADGITPEFSIGAVETISPTKPAEVNLSGTIANPVLSFAIPRGKAGEGAILTVNGIEPDADGNVEIGVSGGVDSVNGKTGTVTITAADLGAVTSVEGGVRDPAGKVTIPEATAVTPGLMSAEDKEKLAGIAKGANKYTHPTGAGYKHIPAGGKAGQVLRYADAGTAAWGDEADKHLSESNGNRVTFSYVDGTLNIVLTKADGEQITEGTVAEKTYTLT